MEKPFRSLRSSSERPYDPDTGRDAVGARLAQARFRLFRTATEAARALGIAGPTYLSHENGTRAVRPDIAAYYAKRLEVPVEWLLFGTGASLPDWVDLIAHGATQATLSISSIILPEQSSVISAGSNHAGLLIRSTSVIWAEIVRTLEDDWSVAYKIPSEKWEEIFAGAFKNDGYDEVTLTPRSGDLGRDVIAVKNGVGAVRILGSFKAYRPGHLITRAHVHEMAGVVSSDPRATKGIITTTSDFAPRLMRDENLKRIVPYRLELMNGVQLQEWLRDLRARK